jgi:acetyl esterase/lipase
MADMSRRAFALAAGGAFALAALGTRIEAAAQASQASKSDPLYFIDPDLRPAARQVQKMGPSGGKLTKDSLTQLRSGGASIAPTPLPQVPVSERHIPGRNGMPDVTVYVINADPNAVRPVVVHTHGGGYISGAAKWEVRYLQAMALELDCVVVTVEYRLAPETTYAGSKEDNYTALAWTYANAGELGIDRNRIALMGESAGGGHAALLAQTARDRGEVPLVLQVLIYPMLDDRTGSTHSVPAPIGTIGWTAQGNRFGWESFLGVEPGGPNVPSGAVPAREKNLVGLPPAFIGVGSVDLFVSEDIEYGRRLIETDIPTDLLVVPGAFHGFDRVAPETSVAKRFTLAKHNALRRAFGRTPKI